MRAIALAFFAFIFAASLLAQAESLIQKSLDAGRLTHTYQEWESSPYHPENIIEQIWKQPAACEEFSNLSDEELSQFYGVLTEEPNQANCQARLIERIEAFISAKQFSLSLSNSTPSIRELSEPSSESASQTREQIVDTAQGPRFINKRLLRPMEIALTLDDGPHPVLTRKLLDILDDHNVKATYFVVGRQVENNPDVLLEVEAAGHSIGTHSYSHPSSTLSPLSDEKAYIEFDGGYGAALNVLDRVAPFFRFPYGARNKFLVNYMVHNNISDFFWDIDPRDWDSSHSVESLYDYALEQVERTKGGILLCHDVQARTIAVMPALIAELKARGYSFVVYRPKQWLTK